MTNTLYPTEALPTPVAVDDCLRFIVNELRAIGSKHEISSDRKIVARRLTDLAEHIEKGGEPPAVCGVLKEALLLPIQR